jgi:ankyrin repeat protein
MTVGCRAMLGPAVLLLTAAALMGIRAMAEPSCASELNAAAFFDGARTGDLAAMQHAMVRDRFPVDLRESGSGMTPLMHAVGGRQAAAVEWLLAHGADVNACSTAYGSALAVAASRRDDAGMVARLLEHGADPNACAADGLTPLMQAASWNDAESLALLLRAGARIDARSRFGNTAMSIAIADGHEDIVRLLERVTAREGERR